MPLQSKQFTVKNYSLKNMKVSNIITYYFSAAGNAGVYFARVEGKPSFSSC